MRLTHDFFSRTLTITNSDNELRGYDLMLKLYSIFNLNPETKELDISGLDVDEITDLHNALISLDNRPESLNIHFQLEKNAEARLREEFSQWKNIKFYRKTPSSVDHMQDWVSQSGNQLRKLNVRPAWHSNSVVTQPEFVSVNPSIVLRADTKEGAATGINFHKQVNFRR